MIPRCFRRRFRKSKISIWGVANSVTPFLLFYKIMKSFESTLILKSECDKLGTWFAYNANKRKRRHNYDTYAEEVDGVCQGV